MGEDYASQTRSEFDWYNPHLYNYSHPLLFYKTFGFFSISFERKNAGVFFTSILRSHKCEIIYTRFHAFMLSSTLAHYVVEKKRVSQMLFIILVRRYG